MNINTKRILFLSILIAFLIILGGGIITELQSKNAEQKNIVKIVSPAPNDRVGGRITIKGKSEIYDNSKVWILVHLKLLKGQWWPQPELEMDAKGNWEGIAYIGGPQDLGMDFEIAVAAFDKTAEAEILKYHDHGLKTGQWVPIKFPKTTSPVDIVIVNKYQ